MLLALLVALPLLASPVMPALARLGRGHAVACLPAALFAGFATLLPAIESGQAAVTTIDWIPSLGIALAFRADGLSLLFALLITGIGTAVFLFAATYLARHPDRPRFFGYLTLFMGAMLGAVLADDLIALLVFWELTSLASFLLIGFEPEDKTARRAAQQGLLITVGGGLALLAGAIVLGEAAGSYRISVILAQGSSLASHPAAGIAIALIAIGAFAKSAQAPLHVWLANAMVAPTPVSAYLHSATMVKLGVYLMARLNPTLGDTAIWTTLLQIGGLATMLTGSVLALRETDLKRMLAYSTVVSLGTLMVLIALPYAIASFALIAFLIVHALYKACLFLVAGIIDHEAGTRDTTTLSGLRHRMPLTAAVALLGGLSMAGLPPFIGFVGKELVYQASLDSAAPSLPVLIALIANAVMVAVAGVLTLRVFFGPPASTPQTPHDPPWPMLAGPAALALLGLVFGIAPWLANDLVLAAARSVAPGDVPYALALWHGFTPILALSGATLLLGCVLYRYWTPLHRLLAGQTAIGRLGPDAQYDRLIDGLQRVARWQTRRIQSGSLRRYVAATLAIFVLAIGGTLCWQGGLAWPAPRSIELTIAIPILLTIAAIAVVRARDFVAGVLAAGMVGFGMALVFLFHGAPDLAFTQFSVEAVAIVILLAIVGRMPFRDRTRRTTGERRTDAVIAIGIGGVATLVLLAVLGTPFDGRYGDYFMATSLPEAHGRNVVNVIIVDFRALDTLGEITVLALAALAAAAVFTGVSRHRDSQRPDSRHPDSSRTTGHAEDRTR
ncbi:MAG: hydrogen gas-evolving membrane-bound hydrogenase subunit E [Lautropia sp.]